MTREGYVGISIPKQIMNDVDKIIDNNTFGYTSRAEFFKDAARQLLTKINSNGSQALLENKKEKGSGWDASNQADEKGNDTVRVG